ncbi:MAG: RES family NAD+ phosphorylase [Chloroflexi bacterium]|nr:RES family NAD+ phosphorylase [Chloroflexota bacterium]MBV9602688.1 RES family NAD+ phosphorylase [Chloroflexota bacterium]
MSNGLVPVPPDRLLYRVGRTPNAWAWPDWRFLGPDGTFGNRWDDPDGIYRVLYACSQRVGAFVETLARFRPDLEVVAGLLEIDGSDDGSPPGAVPRSWLDTRACGEATVEGVFADVGEARSLTVLRIALAVRALYYGLADLDGATIRVSAPRRFTQEISRFVYESDDAGKRFTGIRYLSRLGNQFVNWAIFEPPPDIDSPLQTMSSDAIQAEDPDLAEAGRILDIEFR